MTRLHIVACMGAMTMLTLPSLASDTVALAASPRLPAVCGAADLRASALLTSGMGHREGGLLLTNVSTHACRLTGRPTLTLVEAPANALAVRIAKVGSMSGQSAGVSPRDRRLGIVRPGYKALVSLRWGNWCRRAIRHSVRAVLRLPDSGPRVVAVLRDGARPGHPPIAAPPCLGPSQPSMLDVGPYQVVAPGYRIP